MSPPKCQWFGKPLWADALKYIIPKVEGVSDMQNLYGSITRAINAETQLLYTPESNYVTWDIFKQKYFTYPDSYIICSTENSQMGWKLPIV